MQGLVVYLIFTGSVFLNFQIEVYNAKIQVFLILFQILLLFFKVLNDNTEAGLSKIYLLPLTVVLWQLSSKICLKLYSFIILTKMESLPLSLVIKKLRMYHSVLFAENKGIKKGEKMLSELEKMIMGNIDEHREKCVDPSCVCPNVRMNFKLYDPSTDTTLVYSHDSMDYFYNNPIFYKHLIACFIENLIKGKHQKNVALKIFHTSFIFFELNLTSKAINQIILLTAKTQNFFML